MMLVPAAPSQAQIPPQAQGLVDQGIAAAKQQDYVRAIASFQSARALAPKAPDLYYYLGLSESKIPGRELRAVVWFGAYLAAEPDAPRAADITRLIDRLLSKNFDDLAALIQLFQDSCNQASCGHDSVQLYVGELWLRAHEIKRAEQAADQMNEKNGDLEWQIVEAEARSGNLAYTKSRAERIEDPDSKNRAEFEIARNQALTGDFAGARNTVAHIVEVENPDAGVTRSEAEAIIAEIEKNGAEKPHPVSVAVSEWIGQNDNVNLLSKPLYTDYANYLNSLKADDPRKLVVTLQDTAKDVIDRRGYIQLMVKELAARH
jgi:tetratricopeptide (TPR) repeat protein